MRNNQNVMHFSQLFRLMVLFELGSALVFPLNVEAKEAGWISTLLGMALALLFYVVFCYIARDNPRQPLTVVIEGIIGRVPGKILAFLYTLFFIYQASRQFNDFALLMNVSVFDQTPIIMIHAMMVVTIGYVLSLGIVVLARTGEVFYVVMLSMILLSSVLIVVSGIVDLERLMPILGDGVGSILMSFPRSVNFPFTEVIAFMMLTPFLKERGSLLRTGIISLIFSGLILAWITALNVSVLGVDILSQSFFPFLMSISEVNISNFIQRLDVIAVMMLIIGVFFKASIFYAASVVAVYRLFHMTSYRTAVLLVGMVTFLSAIVISPNSSHHIQEGLISNQWFIYLPFEMTIPVLLGGWVWLRNKFKREHNT
ncbi:GerAB/ArcD/ProY family transporter [Paenibacillus sp. FSL R10-2734]|uniref:GerAB/ArcD/ProY family transporter n=1 Tax=Paenibacillus sp. FSL R10-2734 TaxID=2954691 RepID=UPI0030D72A86